MGKHPLNRVRFQRLGAYRVVLVSYAAGLPCIPASHFMRCQTLVMSNLAPDVRELRVDIVRMRIGRSLLAP